MSEIPGFPPVVDDLGDGRSGTDLNKAFFEQIESSIADELYFATAPDQSPGDTTREVIDARDAYPNLDARLDAMDAAIALAGGGAVTAEAIGGVNLAYNEGFDVWLAGDDPAGWSVQGAGASVAPVASPVYLARPGAQLTGPGGGVDGWLVNEIVPGTHFGAFLEWLKNRSVSIGARVYCAQANAARLVIDDGVTPELGTFHPGDATWRWMTLSAELASVASVLRAGLSMNEAGVASIDQLTVVVGAQPPSDYTPSPSQYGEFMLGTDPAGTPTTGILSQRINPRACAVRDIYLMTSGVQTADFTVTLQRYNGATWDNVGTVTIPSAASYIRGDVAHQVGTVLGNQDAATGLATSASWIRWSIDTAWTAGTGMTAGARYMRPMRAFEQFADAADWGV